jgi:hypothetical protein
LKTLILPHSLASIQVLVVLLPALACLLMPSAVHAEDPASSAARQDSVIAELERRIDLLAAELERERLGPAATADRGEHGLGPAASKVYRADRGVSIGGYGEMLYETYAARRDDNESSQRTDRLDFLRAIVYFGYKFSDRWLLNSEVEFEHGSTGKGGEVSVEFAYLDYMWRPEVNVRAGLVLVPMGLVNELHEPTVFRGTRRPLVEQAIIPTTWRENGVGAHGDVGMASYRTVIINGLDASGFSAAGIRGGRQSGAKAAAEDFAWVGRLDVTGVPGLLVGGSVYAGQSGQGLLGAGGRILQVGTTLAEGHVEWKRRGLMLRGLAAWSWIDEAGELNTALGLPANDAIAAEQGGGYAEAGFDVFTLAPRGELSLIPFLRYERLDTQAKMPRGTTADPALDQEILTVGLNFSPIDPVVFKLDYQDIDNAAGTGLDQFNVAVGYIF